MHSEVPISFSVAIGPDYTGILFYELFSSVNVIEQVIQINIIIIITIIIINIILLWKGP